MSKTSNDLIYGLNDKPPFFEIILIACQHLLAIFIPIITPSIIISNVLKLDVQTSSYLISMALIISGVSTFIQVKKFGPIGSGLLSVQGTSFAFLGPIMAISLFKKNPHDSLSMIFGVCMVGSFIEMFLSRFIHRLKQFISPLVTGTVVTLIGLSLIKVGMLDMAGGIGSKDFASFNNMFLSFLVLFLIILTHIFKNKYFRMCSIIIGITIGNIVAFFMGMVDFEGLKKIDFINVPIPFKYGLDFDISLFFPMAIIYIITTIESSGDLTATSMVSGEPISGEKYIKRIKGGILGDGFNSFLASIFNTFPNTTFSQNNGIIQLTGTASRYVGYYLSLFLIILGIFPIVGGFFQLMPKAVLGGASIIMFGTVAAAGIKIISTIKINRRAIIILAVSLGLGIGVQGVPEILNVMPKIIQSIFISPITTGGLTVLVLNTIIPEND